MRRPNPALGEQKKEQSAADRSALDGPAPGVFREDVPQHREPESALSTQKKSPPEKNDTVGAGMSGHAGSNEERLE